MVSGIYSTVLLGSNRQHLFLPNTSKMTRLVLTVEDYIRKRRRRDSYTKMFRDPSSKFGLQQSWKNIPTNINSQKE